MLNSALLFRKAILDQSAVRINQVIAILYLIEDVGRFR